MRFKNDDGDDRSYAEKEECKVKCEEMFGSTVSLAGDEWFRGFELHFVDESIDPIFFIAKSVSYERHCRILFKEEILILDKATKKPLFTYLKVSGAGDDPEYEMHEEFQKDFLKGRLSLDTPDDRFDFMCWLASTAFNKSPYDSGIRSITSYADPESLESFWDDFERGKKKRKL
jgi:hypothetical protein